MSELKSYYYYEDRIITPATHQYRVYHADEADKVIAELEDHNFKMEKLFDARNSRCIELQKQLRHQKYKRCLAMARWCEATALWCYQAANTLPAGFHATLYGKRVMIEPDRLFKRHELLTKWRKRWLELADKFKEAK